MKSNECLIHIDFSENYSCKYHKEIQGKGAPDGVGGLLKRTADRLVSQGEDISTAKHLFNALVNTNTAVKIFYIKEATVEKAIQKMPQRLPAVPCTMRIHQVITQAPGKLTYRDVSCLCSTKQILHCQCYQAQAFDFKVNSAVPAPRTTRT